MRKSNLDLYDGIGTWKRRPIRAGRKTYMPSHKRWGKITVTIMPTPEGQLTTSQLWSEKPQEEVAPVVEEEQEDDLPEL
jgi:hypothetical protein